ncbi:hypothetical protein KJ966_25695 [bacterium]|nr:hypothetical protein [bacterium]
MKKLKKCQRVESYLNKLMLKDGFGMEELERLKHTSIVSAGELEGIGDRTISNVLNEFKIKKGLESRKKKKIKREIVEDYINSKLQSGELSVNQLMTVKYNDIKDAKELRDVGKTTITCALGECKKKHDKKSFEKGVLDFLTQERKTLKRKYPNEQIKVEETEPSFSERNGIQFVNEDIELIRKMITEFKSERSFGEDKQAYELRELKHALNYVGINPTKLVRLYWEDISKDFMNQKILSGNIPVAQIRQMASQGLK